MQPTIFRIPNTDLVFIGMPKAGNSSVLTALSGFLPSDKAKSPGGIQKKFDEYEMTPMEILSNRSRWFVFTVVRNPWDRVISHYADKVVGPNGLHKRLTAYPGFRHGMPFEEYLHCLKMHWGKLNDAHVASQKQICMFRGAFLPNYVMRLERIKDDFGLIRDRVSRKHGKDVELPHVNKSRSGVTRDIYNEASKKMVGALYADDISFFGYSF